MRLFISLFLLSVFVIACKEKTPQEKAEAAVKAYLTTNLNDPKSYELVSFEPIKNDSSEFNNTPEYKKLEDSLRLFDGMAEDIRKEEQKNSDNPTYVLRLLQEERSYSEKSYNTVMLMKSFSETFKPQFIGYYINHKYRAKNKMNATVLNDDRFYLDTLFNVIIKK